MSLLLVLILMQVCVPRATRAHEEENNKTVPIQMKTYRNSSFTREYKFPVTLGHEIDVYVEMRDIQENTVLLPKECHITPYENVSHHEAQGYRLINNYCPADASTNYIAANDRASRFKFTIKQYFGVAEQYMFLHCTITTCQRAEEPRLTIFNCDTQAEYCPHPGEKLISVGPFVVLPVGFKHDRESQSTPMPKFVVASGKKGPTSAAEESKNCPDYAIFIVSCIGCFLFGIIVTLVTLLLICKINANKNDQSTGHAHAGVFHV